VSYPFARVHKTIAGADIAFANLECVLSEKPFTENKTYLLRGKPQHSAILAKAGFDILSVANNHSLDCGPDGLKDTLHFLHTAGIKATGQTNAATILRRNGLRFAFLAYCDPRGVPNGGGLAKLDPTALPMDIAAARAQADIVVCSFHWGNDNALKPTDDQR